MTDRELLYVITMAEHGSLTKAAERLFVAQPSLSLFLKRLEETLGVALFTRTPTGLELTPAGARYVEGARQIQKLYRDMSFEIGGISQMYHGQVRLGITSHLGTMMLPFIIPQYKKFFPNIQIELLEANSTQLETLLMQGRLDLALMHRPIFSTHITLESIVADPFLMAVSPENHWAIQAGWQEPYPVAKVEMLAELPMIMVSQQQRIGQISSHILSLAGVSPTVAFTTRNFDTARSMAAVGLGATFVPASYTQFFPCVRQPFYFALPPQWEGTWDLCIAYPKQNQIPRPCAEFTKLVKDYVAENGEVFF